MSGEGQAVWREGAAPLSVRGWKGCGRWLGRWLRPLGPVVLVGVALVVAGFWLGRLRPPPLPLQVPAQALELGDVWENPALECLLPIRNVTARAVRIEGFVVSCACARVEPKAVVVPAGGEVTIHLRLRLELPPTAWEPREFAVHLSPQVEGYSGWPIDWVLHGRLKRAAVWQPPQLFLGTQLYHGAAPLTSLVHLHVIRPVEHVRLRSASPWVTADLVSQTATDYQVRLHISSQAPVGPLETQVQVVFHLADDREELGPVLRVTGRVRPMLEAVPEQICWGLTPVGALLKERVWVPRRRGISGQFVGVEGTGTAQVVLKRADATGWEFEVCQGVTQAGPQQQEVRLQFRVAERVVETPVLLLWHGFITKEEKR
jgi:hypothetical protein